MDAPVWSLAELRDQWLRVGGNAAYADIAAAVAMATSGGRTSYVAQQEDGTVNRGLWGISSKHGQASSHDPNANARGAVELSNNGTDWRDWQAAYDGTGYLGPLSPVRNLVSDSKPMGQYPTAGNQPTTKVQSTQTNNFADEVSSTLFDWFMSAVGLKFGLFIGAIIVGLSMIFTGFVIMFISLRQVKNVGTFVLETGAAGVGFGAGAALLSGNRGRMRRAMRPPGSSGTTRIVRPTPKPKPPSGKHSTGVPVQETLLRSRHRAPVSEGGKGLGSPIAVSRNRVAPEGTSWPNRNRKRTSPLTGRPMDD